MDARSNYNRLARWYDILAGRAERECNLEAIRILEPGGAEDVLEIGFGTGQMLVKLAQRVGPSGTVAGVDISDRMVEIATERVRRAGAGDRVTLLRGDVRALPHPEHSVDAVLMSFTLELLSQHDGAQALAECRRVLRRTGRLCVVAMATAKRPGLMSRLYGWAHRLAPNLVDCRPIDLSETVRLGGLAPVVVHRRSLWGLPVELVLARPG